ncbi:putative DUF341 domain oxidoreductase, partial [Cadophora sp. MPI-SDFR-AT-0126]
LRFLCLHGAGTNSDVDSTNSEFTDPISEELRKDNSAVFHFIDGEEDSGPGPGIEGLFEGPYFSFYAWPRTCTTEDEKAVEEAYKLIYAAIEQEGPFDGILGFSQGATLAFQFLSQHAKRFPYDPPNAVFRCGVFICGPPPFRVISGQLVCDEDLGKIRIPSLHIVGKEDEILEHSLHLFELCEGDCATLLHHGKGHTIPRDKENVMAIAKAIRELSYRAV